MSVTVDPTIVDIVNSAAASLTVATQDSLGSKYRTCTLKLNNIVSAAGSGAGASVATSVTFTPPLPSTVTNLNVHVTPNQDAVPFVTSKSTLGFTFTLNPRLAANTLSTGANDILISWDA